jgi:formylglycine-generating enzyme required for sulfatase activity
MKRFNQPCSGDTHPCQDWHPMKGPLATQTLVGAIGTEPFHWRGDREDLSAFNPAFQMLLGDDTRLSDPEMTDLRSFLGTLRPPPNPYRNFDGSVKTTHANGGNPARGEALFHSPELNCASCHAQSTGSKPTIVAAGLLLEPQGLKVPQLQTLYQKTGFNKDAATSLAGFGFTHDGSEDTIAGLLLGRGIDHSQRAAVQFRGEHAADDVRDLEAFLLSFSSATHPAMGVQTTVAEAPVTPAQEEMVSEMIRIAATGAAGLIVKGKEENLSRGYVYALDGLFQSDRAAERLTAGELLAKAGRGSEMTFTVVPYGSRIRMGIDRDSDGVLDQDEVDACGGEGAFNPQDTTAANECEPGSPFFPFQRGDANADRRIDLSDAVAILQALFLGGFLACADAADTNDDGEGNISDPISILNHLFLGGPAPPPPFTVCGPDFTEDTLGCDAYASCASAAETFTSSVGLEVVEIRPGSFLMGSPLDEEDRDIDEALHRVTITRALWIGLTEVTQAQYRAVTGFDPSRFNDCPSCPVTDVTWAEATEFCRQLTLRDRSSGLIGEEDRYRLPTEAEWEYACRAGTVSRFHFGDAPLCELLPCGGACEHASPYAWWCENSGARPHPVAQKLPNAWGLYDMHGNVFEWCSDWYGPYAEGDAADPEGPAFSSYKVMRGGAFLDPLRSHRSAGRQAGTAGASQPTVGFRAVLEKG